MKRRYTHFLSIPCNGSNFRQGFSAFKTKVLEENVDGTITESLFQNPAKLHLTLGVMTLSSDEEKKQAVETLSFCKEHVISSVLPDGKLNVRMQGISIFNDNPRKASVLYSHVSNPNDEQMVQRLADGVRRCFMEKGLLSEFEKFTLHVTLMNSYFRSRQMRKMNQTGARTFNASDIIKKFAEYDFGIDEISTVELSSFGNYGEDGYYLPLSKIYFS
ncbi:activating signal cointegrator 1 complex subunit [Nesidiocoris tenuis]|uniref:Activating signal cointegrator 1 complex subunit n=1 Tax=Nesidiocoris tenuis TaxID=355587 RepID=A0ABN7AYL6_9HEMI|nr:activating signal cointegrator 1 complex subunit [Nesidiocoris tenuis]